MYTVQVLLLERRVAELEKESEASGEQHTRLRQENLQLVHRANAFEEQLKEQELQADEELQQETRRHKEALSKLERERGLEIENMQARWGDCEWGKMGVFTPLWLHEISKYRFLLYLMYCL